jgi:hypothetical protein
MFYTLTVTQVFVSVSLSTQIPLTVNDDIVTATSGLIPKLEDLWCV